jgi:prefoldin alpha subunit
VFLFCADKNSFYNEFFVITVLLNHAIEITMSSSSQDTEKKQVTLKPLDVEQLKRVPVRELAQNAQIREQELAQLQAYLQQLHAGYDRFRQSRNVLDQLAAQTSGRQVMIPLTQSLYVPGELSDSENVLVDIGTGYFVKKVCVKIIVFSVLLIQYINNSKIKMQRMYLNEGWKV